MIKGLLAALLAALIVAGVILLVYGVMKAFYYE